MRGQLVMPLNKNEQILDFCLCSNQKQNLIAVACFKGYR